MGILMNDDSAKKWHQLGVHVRQKEPAPSAEVRRTTPEVVRAPSDKKCETKFRTDSVLTPLQCCNRMNRTEVILVSDTQHKA